MLRIAAAQYPIDRLPDLAALKAKLSRWIAQAAAAGADLVVFPEYALMEIAGTCDDRIAGDLTASLEVVTRLRGGIDAHCAALGVHHQLHVLAPSGPLRRADGSIVNAAQLSSPAGRTALCEKAIMTPFEHRWGVVAGQAPCVYETALGRIGVLICYDSEFPVLARRLVDAGAQILLVPSCTENMSGFHRVRTAALARALEGTCVVVQAPTVGTAPWSPAVDINSGAAGIYVPAELGVSDTGVVVQGPANVARLVIGEVDLARLAALVTQGEMRNRVDWVRQPNVSDHAPAAIVDLA